MFEKIRNFHYPVTQPSVFDESEMTVLELTAKTAYKVNELIDDLNEVFQVRTDFDAFKNATNEKFDNYEYRLNGQSTSINLLMQYITDLNNFRTGVIEKHDIYDDKFQTVENNISTIQGQISFMLPGMQGNSLDIAELKDFRTDVINKHGIYDDKFETVENNISTIQQQISDINWYSNHLYNALTNEIQERSILGSFVATVDQEQMQTRADFDAFKNATNEKFDNYENRLNGQSTSIDLLMQYITDLNNFRTGVIEKHDIYDNKFQTVENNISTIQGQISFMLPGMQGNSLDIVELKKNFNFTETNTIPSSPTDAGDKGMIRSDGEYLYICLDNGNWKRIPFDTWEA